MIDYEAREENIRKGECLKIATQIILAKYEWIKESVSVSTDTITHDIITIAEELYNKLEEKKYFKDIKK